MQYSWFKGTLGRWLVPYYFNLQRFITYSYKIQMIHALEHWNPQNIALREIIHVSDAGGTVAIQRAWGNDECGICTREVLVAACAVANFKASTTADGKSFTVISRLGECIRIKPRMEAETSWMNGVSENPLWMEPTCTQTHAESLPKIAYLVGSKNTLHNATIIQLKTCRKWV